MQPIYLDYNATTPVDETVLQAMLPYFSEQFGNAASTTHPFGWTAKDAVELAQNQVATALHCEAQQVVFTSGSTEAINLAIKGVWELYSPRKGKHIVTCQTEHKAVLDVCAYLEKFHDAEVTYLPVNELGLVDLEELKAAITDKTILVSIMHSNNETGVIQPVKQIADIVHEKGSIFMSDCTQSIGKLAIDVNELGIDLCCISAHKFYGPKGIGALYYRRRGPRVALQPQIHGGGHQRGIRSGTLNVPLIVGLGAAIEQAVTLQPNFFEQTLQLRDYLEAELRKITTITVNGMETLLLRSATTLRQGSVTAPRQGSVTNQLSSENILLPNTLNVSFTAIEANKMIQLTNGAMAVSTGSACTSATLKQSHVLLAMHGEESKSGSIRFSLGRSTTKTEIDKVVGVIKERL